MIWVLVWAVLVLAAAALLFLLGRRIWRQTLALTAELGVATDRLAEVTDMLADRESGPDTVAGPGHGVPSAGPRRRP